MPRSRGGAGPTPKVGKLIGSGSKGTQGGKIRGAKNPTTIGPAVHTDPSQSGNPDVVADRYNQTQAQKNLSKQLRKNKSTGISVGRGRKR